MHLRVEEHIRRFFRGHVAAPIAWLPGPTARLFPSFHVLAVEPGPRTALWSYVSVGAFEAADPMLEFLVLAERPDASLVELLAMAAYYHRAEGLGYGHTIPIGRPWLPGSRCDHLLVSLPYPFGADLEVCEIPGGNVQVLWLLPIAASERAYKQRCGLEALEQRFDDARLEYWQVERAPLA